MEAILSDQWFLGMHWAWLLAITVVGFVVLVRGADQLVEGASGLAARLGMPKIIVGATIVSLGTTSPEAAVSVMAAWNGNPGLALGNAVGSIVADTGLIFGLGCMLAVLPADAFVLRRQGWIQFGSGVALALVCYLAWMLSGDAATLGRTVGFGFLAALAAYLWISVRWARVHPEGEPFVAPEGFAEAEGVIVPHPHAEQSVLTLVVMILGGLVLVVVSSHVVVGAVSELAVQWGVPQIVVASTIVALGTSMPELMVAIAAIRRGHPELLVGNVLGADILNVLFVIGASAAAAELPIVDTTAGVRIPELFLYLHLPAMLLILGLFRLFSLRAERVGRFSRWNGAPLLAMYVAYTVTQYALS